MSENIRRYQNVHDGNPQETQEWLESQEDLFKVWGQDRVAHVLAVLLEQAHQRGVRIQPLMHRNRFKACPLPKDLLSLERVRVRNAICWNAAMMVVRAQHNFPELGGHIATCVSIALLYDIAYEYFFRAGPSGDCVYFQGHSSPLMYARSYQEGYLSLEQLERFRREVGGGGLPSYPHPQSMPDYWQFPTVSMGLGLLQAIHQARLMKYLDQRGILALSDRKVWAFVGDGEMREPESVGSLLTAASDGLDHLIVVLNANLQGLDGPCRSQGSVIREWQGVFEGCGWHVIKLIWNQAWLRLFAQEPSGRFEAWVSSWVDADHQSFYAQGPAYLHQALAKALPDLSDWLKSHEALLEHLAPAGHDPELIYQGYRDAFEHRAQPSVVIVQTIKGFGLPMASLNLAHQKKHLTPEQLALWAQSLNLPLSKEEAQKASYVPRDPEAVFWPALPRRTCFDQVLDVQASWSDLLGMQGQFSTTASFVRVLSFVLRQPQWQPFVVPIVADEARTFGMEGLFKTYGVYHALPIESQAHDAAELTGYREDPKGQLLQEGITEAGALASWMAAATAYSVHHRPLLPFYIFYSMFGFQRVMDLIWAAADARARGFLLGATSGRSTLAGEGLQHADGHSLLLAAVVPSVEAFDPAWHAEVVILMRYGIQAMWVERRDLILYMTLVNESLMHRPLPAHVLEQEVILGMYRYASVAGHEGQTRVHLLASGAIFHEAFKAYEQLASMGHAVSLYSVTSFGQLRAHAERQEMEGLSPYFSAFFAQGEIAIAVSDYVRLLGDMIRRWMPCDYHVLGTDGFGCSDTRTALRRHFQIDAQALLEYAQAALKQKGQS